MTETRLERVIVAASDVGKMARFYEAILGVPSENIDSSGQEGRALRFGTVTMLLISKETAGVTATENIHQLRFVVDDIQSTMLTSCAAGGVCLSEMAEDKNGKTCCLRDPDGNSVELLEARTYSNGP
jgi:predicted enzyme related to lactoylglutathione lyase